MTIFQVGTRVVLGKFPTLLWSGLMDGTPFTHPGVRKKDTGTVLPGFEGILSFQVTLSDFTIRNPEIPGHPVYIVSHDEQTGTGKTIAAVTGTVVTENLCSGKGIPGLFPEGPGRH